MNVKIAIIAGLVATCPSVLRAEESSNTANGNHPSEAKPEVSFQTIIWTNDMVFHEDGNPLPFEGSTNGSLPGFIMEKGDMTMTNEYQVLAVYREADNPEISKSDAEGPATANTDVSLRELLEANGPYRWRYGTNITSNTPTRAIHSHKKPMQILVIEPLNSRKDLGFAPDRLRIQEYLFDANRPEKAWYEWINPRLFLMKWADYWANGTEATPVALMIISF